MAKVKVGPPAVSRYHQVKCFLMSNDSSNLPDHDFPVPGYLLNVFRYMFLESKKNNDQNHPGLVNSSIYNSHNTEYHNISYDMLMVNGPSQNIFHTLACQAETHLNVKMSAMECKDQIIAYMKEQEEEKIPNTLNKSLDLETIEAVLHAASALFKCEIVIIYHSEAGTQFHVIKNAKKSFGKPTLCFMSFQ